MDDSIQRYDLGTPVLLSNLSYRIHSNIVNTIGSTQKFKDPTLSEEKKAKTSAIDKLKYKIMDRMLLTPESQLNYIAE